MMLNFTLDGVMPLYRELFAQHDLTDQQWRILRVLWDVGQANSVQLAQATLLPKPSLVGILDRLEKKGLIARVRSKTDRRNVTITPTAEGRALAQVVLPQAEAIHIHLRGLMPDDDWDRLVGILDEFQRKSKATRLGDILPAPEVDITKGADNV